MFVPIPVGSQPPPQLVRIPGPVAARIRSRALVIGVLLIVLGLGLALSMVLYALGSGRDMGNTAFGAMAGGATGMLLFICGFGIVGVRSYVAAESMDVAGLRMLRRLLVVFCIATLAMAGLAAAAMRTLAGSGGAVALVLPGLAAACAILGVLVMWPMLRLAPVR